MTKLRMGLTKFFINDKELPRKVYKRRMGTINAENRLVNTRMVYRGGVPHKYAIVIGERA